MIKKYVISSLFFVPFVFNFLSGRIPLVDSRVESRIKKAILNEDTAALEGIYRQKFSDRGGSIDVNAHLRAGKLAGLTEQTYITPLQFALITKKNKSAKFLVSNLKADVNEIDLVMQTPFQYRVPLDLAIQAGNFEIVPFLIDNGARLNPVIDQYKNRPYADGASSLNSILSTAIKSRNTKTIKLLITKGIAIFPEHYQELIQNHNLEILEWLLESKKIKATPELLDAALQAKDESIISFLLKKNVPITASAVVTSLKYNDFSHAKQFIDMLKNSNERADGQTIVYVAAEMNQGDFLKYCIEKKKADVNKTSRGTPEHTSSQYYPIQNFEEAPPLAIAIHKGYFPLVRYLIEQGANPNATVSIITTDEHCSEYSGECGPPVSSKETISLLTLAQREKRVDIATYLIDHGAKEQKQNP